MEKKKGFAKRAEAFFNGKGFYIVLFLCIAVIGVSTWAMLGGRGTNVEDSEQAAKTRVQSPPVVSVGPREDVTMPPQAAQQPQATQTPEVREGAIAEDVPPVPERIETPPPVELPAWSGPQEPSISQQIFDNAAASFIWPLAGDIGMPYSITALVYSRTMADWRAHAGVDIASELGAVVMAVSSGTVESIYRDDMYGVTVVIKHRDDLRSIYSNLADVPTVYVGDSVFGGEIIGSVGHTALAESGEAPHLHFCLTRNGEYIDPDEVLP